VAGDTLSIRDNRTGTEVEIPISDGTINATDLRQLGLMSYDPAFLNTASTRSCPVCGGPSWVSATIAARDVSPSLGSAETADDRARRR